ncbi:MAG: YbaK/EbsC family protein [Jatrophihabitans sp.]|uniref:YbaK/EbsC family protein n=1 Tax=Jatrophihabitans sp. TaxID=1932789 RepID=UPI0039125AF4
MSDEDTYCRLIALLDGEGAAYRLIDHAPEGVTDVVSALRGHPAAHAAKCLVLIVKLDRRTTRYVLAVVPGDERVDLAAVRRLYGARYVGFADAATAERLAGSVPGTVLPFSFDPELEAVADVAIERAPELFFNAARLERSVAMSAADYLRIARPRLAPIAAGG